MFQGQKEFWQTRYQEKETPWDLGRTAPPFIPLLKRFHTILKPGKMVVLGSGYGHDAAFFGQDGFDVIGLDYVPEAVQAASERYGDHARFEQADIFSLDPKYDNAFEYVLEHTCFCAIPPYRRPAYLNAVRRLLRTGGYFIGLIWSDLDEDAPPFPSTQAEIRSWFESDFDIPVLEIAANSVPERQGQELLCLFKKR